MINFFIMKNFFKLFSFILAFQLGVPQLKAQHTEIGIGLGFSTYWGDLNTPSFTSNLFNNSGLAIQLSGRKIYNNRFGIRGSIMYGRVRGNDAKSDIEWQYQRNLNFRSSIIEGAIMAEYYILGFDETPGSNIISPYITAGLSIFRFDPTTNYRGSEVRLQPLGTEGQGQAPYGDKYSLNAIGIPFGGGLKFTISSTINISTEIILRRTNTDFLDDVSSIYVSYPELSRINGTLAANLSSRTNEYFGQSEPIVRETGSQRGGAKVKDYFFTSMVTLNILLTDGKGRSVLGRNKILCPSFK